MSRRRGGHQSTRKTIADLPPLPDALTAPALPAGPAIVYINPAGQHTPIDQTAVTDARDRALCRALLTRARDVLTEAETTDAKHPVGFTA